MAPTVLSVISLILSALALISVIILVLISVFGTDRGSSTALTGQAVLFVSGMVLFTAVTWIFAIAGGLSGFIMMIVDIAVKSTDILWMPITSMVIGLISIIVSVFVY